MQGPAKLDFNERPYIDIWEATQACDLACVHCRACAQLQRKRDELTTDEAKRLIDEIAAMAVPVFVLSGGDPLKRPDIYELGERPGSAYVNDPERHAVADRGSVGEAEGARKAMDAVRWARKLGLPVQINSTMTRRNFADFDAMLALVERLDAVLWSVFFLVPTGRGSTQDLLMALEFQAVFEKLYAATKRVRFDIKKLKPSTIAGTCCSGERKSAVVCLAELFRRRHKYFRQRWAATGLRAHRGV